MATASNGASSAGAVPRSGAAPADSRALTVRECVGVPPLDGGTVVAGRAGLDRREVHWMTVIEGPVDDFVSPGDFVISTGLGYGGERLHDLVADVSDRGGAALVIAVGADKPVESVPPDA